MTWLIVVATGGAEGPTGTFLQAHNAKLLRAGVWSLNANMDAQDLLDSLAAFKGPGGDVAVFEVKSGSGTAGFVTPLP